MAHYGWDGVPARPLMPVSGGTVNGAPFSVPKGAKSMAIHVPGLVGAAATLKLESQAPPLNDQATEVWDELFVFNLSDGTTVQLDGIPEGQVTVLPISATGGGVLRFVASEDQSSVPVEIPVFFSSH